MKTENMYYNKQKRSEVKEEASRLRRMMVYYMAHVLQFLHFASNIPNLAWIGIMILKVGIAVIIPAWKMGRENIVSESRRPIIKKKFVWDCHWSIGQLNMQKRVRTKFN